jgi:histidinol-phosphate/aromatic aminotransferase/cobyric acid decarboxylase-like protein
VTELRAFTTVYSYYLPEVRAAISDVVAAYPHDVFLRSLTPAGLDAFHEPILDKLVAAHRHDVPNLADFPYRYPTAGSEEGIREYLSRLATGGTRRIYMFAGDYEGYREVARTRGIDTVEVQKETPPSSLLPGHWFLSNPSARDGNIVGPGDLRAIAEAGHQVFYDLSYLGSTTPATYDVSHPNVAAVAVSFSKTFGLFYYRIGFLFTREPVPALFANKWFKNVLSLLIAERVLGLDAAALASKYKGVQQAVVEDLNRAHGLELRASDAFLLAHLRAADADAHSPAARAVLERYRRHDGYRLCLTPYFLERTG